LVVITGDQYETLVRLMRGSPDSSANQAARRVLVDGITQAEAVRETDLKRATVNHAVKRYADADELVRKAYAGRSQAFTSGQYDALVKLMRGNPDSPANRAARRVLVDGITQAEAVRETDLKRASVNHAVKRYADANVLVRRVYTGKKRTLLA